MSEAAFEHSRGTRKLCVRCRERKARFRYRGQVKADRDHTYCFECYRSARDRRRAQMLAQAPWSRRVMSPFASARELTDAQLAHRRRMLAHLEPRLR